MFLSRNEQKMRSWYLIHGTKPNKQVNSWCTRTASALHFSVTNSEKGLSELRLWYLKAEKMFCISGQFRCRLGKIHQIRCGDFIPFPGRRKNEKMNNEIQKEKQSLEKSYFNLLRDCVTPASLCAEVAASNLNGDNDSHVSAKMKTSRALSNIVIRVRK